MSAGTEHDEDGVVIDTPALSEQAAQRAVPRVRTLDQMVALANGAEYHHDVEAMIAEYFAALFHHAREHEETAKGTLSLKFEAAVDQYGEVVIDVKPAMKLPDPPTIEGKARAYIDPQTRELVTHKQNDLPLLRDVKKRTPTVRDR